MYSLGVFAKFSDQELDEELSLLTEELSAFADDSVKYDDVEAQLRSVKREKRRRDLATKGKITHSDSSSQRESAANADDLITTTEPDSKDEMTEPSKLNRKPRNIFSPGYGLRQAASQKDNDEETFHKPYPAPAPVAPPLNGNEGWSSQGVTSGDLLDLTHDRAATPRPPATARQAEVTGFEPAALQARESLPPQADTAESEDEIEVVHTPVSAYIAWSPVVYDDTRLNHVTPISAADALEGLEPMTKRGPRSSAPTEDDPRLTTASGWSAVAEVVRDSPPHWRSKNPDNDARGGATNSSWGNVASRAGAGGCHTCGEQGHFARECPNGRGRNCFNCDKPGHISAECPEPRRSRGLSNTECFKCGEMGHMSRECPDAGRGGGGRGYGTSGGGSGCFNCGGTGHMARDCEKERQSTPGNRYAQSSATWNDNCGGGDAGGRNDGWGDKSGGQSDDSVWHVAEEAQQPQEPKEETVRPSGGIHPDRLRMLNGEGAAKKYSQEASFPASPQRLARPEPDDTRSDNGWASRASSLHSGRDSNVANMGYRDHNHRSASVSSNKMQEIEDKQPTPSEDDEFGGW